MSQISNSPSIAGPAAPVNAPEQATPAPAPRAGLPAELRNARTEEPQAPQVQARQRQGFGHTLGKIALGAGRALLAVGSLGLTELILRLIRRAEHATAPAPQAPAPAVPPAPPTAAQFNGSIRSAIDKGQPLPDEYQAALNEALDELRASFGDAVPTADALLNSAENGSIRYEVKMGVHRLAEQLQPAQLKGFVNDAVLKSIHTHAVGNAAQAIFDEVGYDAKGRTLADALMDTIPGFREAVENAENSEQLNAAIEAAKDGIHTYAENARNCVDGKAHGVDEAVRLLAEGLGVSNETVKKTVALNHLMGAFTILSTNISNEDPHPGIEEINRRFAAKAATFVEKKLALYYSTEGLGLSPQLVDNWKASVLSTSTLNDPATFAPIVRAARAVDAQPVLDAIRQLGRGFSVEMVYARLETLSVQLSEALVEAHGGQQKWNDLGGDGQGDARFLGAQAMLDSVPGLREALTSTPGLLDGLKALNSQHQAAITDTATAARGQLEQLAMQRRAAQAAAQQDVPPTPEQIADQQRARAIQQRTEGTVRSAGFGSNISGQVQLLLIGLEGVSPQNAKLAQGVSDPESLPFAHRQALSAAIAEVRARFGADSLPEDFRKAPVPGYHAATAGSLLSGRIARAEASLNAAEVAAIALDLLGASALASVGRAAIMELADASGVSVSEAVAGDIFAMLIKRHPEAGAALHQSDAATVRGFIESVRDDAEAAFAIRRTLDEGRSDVVRRLARNTHRSEDDMRQLLHGDLFRALDVMWKDAMDDAGAGNDFPSVEEARAAVFEHTDAIFLDKYQTWRGMIAFDLSVQLLKEWQMRTLSSPRRGELSEFQDACKIGSAVDAQGFATALGQPNLSTEELMTLLISVTRRLDHEFLTVLADKFDRMDPIATERVSVLSMQAFLDRNTALSNAIAAAPEKAATLHDALENRALELTRAITQGRGDMAALSQELGFVTKGMTILRHVLGMDENA